MDQRVDLSDYDLVEELLRTQAESMSQSGALTVREIIDITGLSETMVYKQLKILKNAGRLDVRHERREALDGRPRYVPAYILKTQSKGSE